MKFATRRQNQHTLAKLNLKIKHLWQTVSHAFFLRVSAVLEFFAASTTCPAVGSLDRALSVRASHSDPLAVALHWDDGDAPFVNLPGASTGHTNAGCFAFKPGELSWSASPTPECKDSLTATILPEGEMCQLLAVDLVRTTDAFEVQLRFPWWQIRF